MGWCFAVKIADVRVKNSQIWLLLGWRFAFKLAVFWFKSSQIWIFFGRRFCFENSRFFGLKIASFGYLALRALVACGPTTGGGAGALRALVGGGIGATKNS